MRIAAMTGAAVAALAAGALATPSFAQSDPCQSREHNNGTTGAVVGGIAGALLGSSIAPHHQNRAGGAVIGGVAGALAGNAIGRSSAKNSDACRYGYNGYSNDYYANGYAAAPAATYYTAPSATYYSTPTSAYVPASGYYDSDGVWHAYAAQASGYYDSDGDWHATAPTYYAPAYAPVPTYAPAPSGYYDSYGEWHPY